MHRMIVKTENTKGKVTTETIRHIPTDQVAARREAARQSAPRGATRTIKVVGEN